jgi:hypothetical protein
MAGKDKGKTPAGGKPKAGKDDKPTDDSVSLFSNI